jgi:hypothetical protein
MGRGLEWLLPLRPQHVGEGLLFPLRTEPASARQPRAWPRPSANTPSHTLYNVRAASALNLNLKIFKPERASCARGPPPARARRALKLSSEKMAVASLHSLCSQLQGDK